MSLKHTTIIVGIRPEAIKMARVYLALQAAGVLVGRRLILVTGHRRESFGQPQSGH